MTSYAMIGLRNFYSENPSKFMELLMQGPPITYRWLAWRMVGTLLLPKTKGAYETYLRQGAVESKWSRVIDNDVNRTFPFHQFFKSQNGSGQKPLKNVLLVYSEHNPEVGYCQSMNFIVAFILMISGSREKEAFWFFAGLLTKSNEEQTQMILTDFIGISGFFKTGFHDLLEQIRIFHIYFKKYLPKLQKHFENVPDALWLNKWFLSLFLYSVPLGLCVRIWDNLLADGSKFLIKVSLSILKLSEA